MLLVPTVGAACVLGMAGSAAGAVQRYVPGRGGPALIRSSATGRHTSAGAGWLGRGRVGSFATGRAATAASGGSSYAGATSQEAPIVFAMSKSGNRITKLGVYWVAACSSGGTYSQGETLRVLTSPPATLPEGGVLVGGRLLRKRAFLATGIGFSNAGGGYGAVISENATGTLGTRSGAGRFDAHVDVTDATGAVVDRCDTGRMEWTTGQ
jgi:hypothetical protein